MEWFFAGEKKKEKEKLVQNYFHTSEKRTEKEDDN